MRESKRRAQCEPSRGVKGREPRLTPPGRGSGYTLPSLQVGFLITNALRFMLSAPGATSWQYTLLQLQAGSALSSPLCFALTKGLSLLLPVAQSLSRPQLKNASVPFFPVLPLDSCPLHSGAGRTVGLFSPSSSPRPPTAPESLLGPLFQVNGMLPILPLLFPVLWVLATACGEARVLAQMSKASPSSLVGGPKVYVGQWQDHKEGTSCAGKEGQKFGRICLRTWAAIQD